MLLESTWLRNWGSGGARCSGVIGGGGVWIPCSIDWSLKSGVLNLVQTDGRTEGAW
jgi:hypothetical protein